MSILTADQVAQFEEQGFLLVSGLMPEGTAPRAEAVLCRKLGISLDDPSGWPDHTTASGHDDPEILACLTPRMAAAAAQLSAEDVPDWRAPSSLFTINAFPQPGPWAHHGPHIDHAIRKDGYKTFPRPMRLASLIYLNDVAPHSGGTVVWPGSHRKILARAEADPERYASMWVLNESLGDMDLGEGVEVPSKAGDILFYHYLCAHSGSRNAGTRPRFAIAHKW